MSVRLPSLRLVASTAAIALAASLALAFSRPVSMQVDGRRIMTDVAPVTVGSEVYLPVRALSAAVGGRTSYDARTGEVTVRRGADTLRLRVGEKRALLNGVPYELGGAPFTVHGRALVRGRDLALAFGSDLSYDAGRGRIDLRTPGGVVAGAPDSN